MDLDPTDIGLDYMRIAIVGGPKSGKTSLSLKLGRSDLHHTDQTIDLPWAQQADFWVHKLSSQTHWVLEGVQSARCIRKGLQPDLIVHCHTPWLPLSTKQESLRKGLESILLEIRQSYSGTYLYYP